MIMLCMTFVLMLLVLFYNMLKFLFLCLFVYCEPLEDVSREVMSLNIAVIEFFAMYLTVCTSFNNSIRSCSLVCRNVQF